MLITCCPHAQADKDSRSDRCSYMKRQQHQEHEKLEKYEGLREELQKIPQDLSSVILNHL